MIPSLDNKIGALISFLSASHFRWASMTNGACQIFFQIALILTGNLSFLNWLTIIPSIWFFDDAFWERLEKSSYF